MRTSASFLRRVSAYASVALVAALGISSTVFADSLTTTLNNPTSVITSPSPCSSGAACTITSQGTQTTSVGGSGGYTNVQKVSTLPTFLNNRWCLNLDAGSALTLRFSSGSITMATNGQFCGTQTSSTQFAFSGPYSIVGGTAPFDKVSGSGTVSGTYDLSTAHLVFNGISGTVDLGSVSSGGSGGAGGIGISATPELDSAVLLGSGLLGLAGYALARSRSRNRSQRTDT